MVVNNKLLLFIISSYDLKVYRDKCGAIPLRFVVATFLQQMEYKEEVATTTKKERKICTISMLDSFVLFI